MSPFNASYQIIALSQFASVVPWQVIAFPQETINNNVTTCKHQEQQSTKIQISKKDKKSMFKFEFYILNTISFLHVRSPDVKILEKKNII